MRRLAALLLLTVTFSLAQEQVTQFSLKLSTKKANRDSAVLELLGRKVFGMALIAGSQHSCPNLLQTGLTIGSILPCVPHILSVSYDPLLLSTRQLMLEGRGFKVTSVEGFIPSMEACKSGSYDLLIIGHSIPHVDKQAIVREAKMHGNKLVLSLLRSGELPVEGASESVDAMRPDLLLECVEHLLGHNRKQGPA